MVGKTELMGFLDQLRCDLPYVPPVPTRDLKRLHRKEDYEGMVRLIRNVMNLDVRLRIGWVNSGGPEEAPAWVSVPPEMPRYGSKEFKDATILLFIRKSFLERSTYAQATIVIAHELSHIVLDSIQHPLRENEKAVDLTAMLLGFSALYHRAAYSMERVDFFNNPTWRRLGYLTPIELVTASRILVPLHIRALHELRWHIRRFKRLIFLWGGLLSIAAIGSIHGAWKRQSIVWSEKAKLQARLPMRVSGYATLTNVRAGFGSLTRVYDLSLWPADRASFEGYVRRSLCTFEAEHIQDGISYTNEYRLATGKLIRISVDSCP